MKKILIPILFFFVTACNQSNDSTEAQVAVVPPVKTDEPILAGLWRGVLQSPGGELPFGIQMAKTSDGYEAKILNGPERVDTSAVVVNGNQVEIQFSWYDERIKATYDPKTNSLSGAWSKTAPQKISSLPFTATKGYSYRFKQPGQNSSTTQVAGI